MTYWTDLFTPATYEAFARSDRTISGFRESQKTMAERVQPGDKLVCYLVRMSRWVGILEVLGEPFIDSTPIFHPDDDPFVVRFKVKVEIWLPLEHTVPIRVSELFSELSFTRNVEPGDYWLGPLRRSLQRLEGGDGKLIEAVLTRQVIEKANYQIDEEAYQKWLKRRIPRSEGTVVVSVPEDEVEVNFVLPEAAITRESIKVQGMLCRLGETMGFRIWLPFNDRSRVLELWHPQANVLLDRLPLNYDQTTLSTIERIDVLWLNGRTIRRAFEVEHTTAIYSGLLRMADLCALLPNIKVALHIVAPEARREKVFDEITRPVFSLLDESPLSARCTYLSYDSVNEIHNLPYLSHTSDSVLEEFAEHAE